MSADQEKKFVIKHVFENVLNMKTGEEKSGKFEEHFGIPWKIKISLSSPWGEALRLYLECSKPKDSEFYCSISTQIAMTIGESVWRTFSKTHTFTQEKMLTDGTSCINWIEDKKYLTNGNLSVKFIVTVVCIDDHRKKLKIFDDDVAKKFSDVVLMAEDQEFYVYKMYLASHSTYFESLFSGNFAESEKSIIELKDIDPEDFQKFLELIHGASTVKDFTVSKILKLADFFDAKTAIQRCKEFLLTQSEKSIKDKFEMANKYKLEDLKKKCISELKTGSEFRSIIPEDSTEFDSDTWKELLLKSASLH